MGCDIHLHIEIKLNGKWEHWGAPHLQRNYPLFAKMAGVRNYDDEIEPIAKPKGLPEDLTVCTKFNAGYDGNDGHSHSWLNCQEIAVLSTWARKTQKKDLEWDIVHSSLLGNGFDIATYPESTPKEITDVRFVFWFDC